MGFETTHNGAKNRRLTTWLLSAGAVGERGLEPLAFRSQSERSAKLNYTPKGATGR